MARLYADEQFPRKSTEHLRSLSHDVLTVQEAGQVAERVNEAIAKVESLAGQLIRVNRGGNSSS